MRIDHLHARRDDGPDSYRAHSSASNRTQAVRSGILWTAHADDSEHAGQSHADCSARRDLRLSQAIATSRTTRDEAKEYDKRHARIASLVQELELLEKAL